MISAVVSAVWLFTGIFLCMQVTEKSAEMTLVEKILGWSLVIFIFCCWLTSVGYMVMCFRENKTGAPTKQIYHVRGKVIAFWKYNDDEIHPRSTPVVLLENTKRTLVIRPDNFLEMGESYDFDVCLKTGVAVVTRPQEQTDTLPDTLSDDSVRTLYQGLFFTRFFALWISAMLLSFGIVYAPFLCLVSVYLSVGVILLLSAYFVLFACRCVPYLLDIPNLFLQRYEKMKGVVVGYDAGDRESELAPIVRPEDNGKDRILLTSDFPIKNETYEFRYLPHTKIAQIIW